MKRNGVRHNNKLITLNILSRQRNPETLSIQSIQIDEQLDDGDTTT